MALRTVTIEPESRQLAPTPSECRRRLERVVAQAQAAIAGGRLDELKPLYAEVSGWEPGRAYEGLRTLTEVAFGSSANLPETRWVALYFVVAEQLLEYLTETPSEPVLLNYLGVVLYELGEIGVAELIFRTVMRLDPELDHVADNLEQATRRKSGFRSPLDKHAITRARVLGGRARRVATAAGPETGLTLSLTMIVKDEEEMLPGCLAAVAPFVDEMIVVDTGSSDRTAEIAESFGAKVVHFPWNGSFSDARNVSLDAATGDWVMYLDADEHLVPEDGPALRTLLGKTWREAFYLAETNYTGGEDAGSSVAHLAMRIFRNRPEYRFEGRIHEQKSGNMPTFLGERFETTKIRIRHYGYLKSRINAREKSQRNIELLLREAKDAPNPFVDFNLGSEYVALGDWTRAASHLGAAWTALRQEPNWFARGYAPMLAARYPHAQRESGDTRGARATLEDGLAIYPDHTELVLQAAMCARDEREYDAAAALAERCLELGDAPTKYSATVGVGTYLARCLLAEIRIKQGRKEDAEEQYLLSLESHPDYVAPVLPLTSLRLQRGADPDATSLALAAERPSAGLLVATALYENGRAAEAEAGFRRILELRPSLGVARIGLVETLLAQKRYEEAAVEAAVEPDDSPVSRQAARSELFARAAAGDAAGLAAALAAAEQRGVGAHELTLYRAWHATLAGTEAPAFLPQESGLVALVALEALLRVQEFAAFEQLHGVLERTGLDLRERREGLAQIYLRRGYLDSAAEEWLTVARERPDARAFVGLAQVALAKGLRSDAKTLAGEALALDPGNQAAVRLQEAA